MSTKQQGPNFPAIESEVLSFWKANQVFKKSLELHPDEHVFYDGPPFPTGNPHHGTIFVSILKDSLARFFTMAGYRVPRKWGWDCHGLPIENAVEKKLGITNKDEIEKSIGIETFNNACREFVSSCNDSWETYIDKVGRWVDYDNPYRTLDTSFMESVIWAFKTCYDKELIYKDFRVTPYCYRCETALSISDTRESDSTRPRQDPELVVRFAADESIAGLPTYYLAWTTTPWTLSSNLALTVGEDFTYVAVEKDGEVYVLAQELLGKWTNVFGDAPKIVQSFLGQQLVGKTYQPIFEDFADERQRGCFRLIAADFVTLEDGVGIVHTAPAFGEDDYWACKRAGIAIRNPVTSKGVFSAEMPSLEGLHVHRDQKDVIRQLKERGAVVHHGTFEHNYPHCWRCREPLIYRAMDAWYFAVEKIKPRLIEQAEAINWVPEHVKHGRFGKWLEGARDWNISRSRYWGTPIPVWECRQPGCSGRQVVGSLAELQQLSGGQANDLHMECIDELTIPCPECDNPMHRVREVLDCWFESGSMPYGQCHYPFENKEWFEAHFPADFIVEYPGQIRCWFYYLHVLAVAIFDRPAFKNCLVHGTLLAEDGAKISKSKKNYTDPMQLIDSYGADALRIYLLQSPAASMADLHFKDAGIRDQIKGVILPLFNAYSFYKTYAEIDGHQAQDPTMAPSAPQHALDRWILAELYKTSTTVHGAFSSYHLNKTLHPVLDFLENLTNWYIRRSRSRFWSEGGGEDKKAAYDCLYYVLVSLCKMLAPSAPFITDKLYRDLTADESVHLSAWPDVPEDYADDSLTEVIALTRRICSLGLASRQKTKMRVRQPLRSAQVALPFGTSPASLIDQVEVIKDELNVKDVTFLDDASKIATLRAKPNARRLGPRLGREMQDVIKAARQGQIKQDPSGAVVVYTEDGRSWELSSDEIEIGYEGREGLDVASAHGVLVGLDTQLDDALREEGVANDLNRIIQNMRKDAGFQVSDRIVLYLDGHLQERFRELIAEQALARLVDQDGAAAWEASLTQKISERTFTIKLSRVM